MRESDGVVNALFAANLSLKDPRPLARGMLTNAKNGLSVSYVQSFDLGMLNNVILGSLLSYHFYVLANLKYLTVYRGSQRMIDGILLAIISVCLMSHSEILISVSIFY